MDRLHEYLEQMISNSARELHLEPNKQPYIVTPGGNTTIANTALPGAQINMMIFSLIPDEVKRELPNNSQVEFIQTHNLGEFNFLVKKSPSGFIVTVSPADSALTTEQNVDSEKPEVQSLNSLESNTSEEYSSTAEKYVQTEEILTTNDYVFETTDETASDETVNETFSDEDIASVQDNFVPEQVFDAAQVQQTPAVLKTPPQPAPTPQAAANPQAKVKMNALFNKMAEIGASDLHMSVSVPPMVRKDGKIAKLDENGQPLSPDEVKQLLQSIMPQKNIEEFAKKKDTDFAYEIKGLARFRANIFMDRKGMGGVFRIIPSDIMTAEDLNLSRAVMDLCDLSKGLVVVTGPTGSGKSTTLCAMVDAINKQREDHIITIEDPIEFTHENQKCLVNQREVHNHTDSFKDALRAALREDPDVLLVGEMRDLETISIAIETAETGHLVFGTLHTTTAASTVDRISDQFPADRQQQIRVMLSESLRGIIAQTLLPKKGGGRIAALEILIVTPAISNLIREGKTFQIPSAMQTGKNKGMVMLNDALMELVNKGLVESKDAYVKAVDKTGFEMLLQRSGKQL